MQWSKSAFHGLPSSTYLGESFPRKSKDTKHVLSLLNKFLVGLFQQILHP